MCEIFRREIRREKVAQNGPLYATVMELFKQLKEEIELVRIFYAPHPLANFEIQKYYKNEPRFNGVYSMNNLPKTKDGHM